MRQPESKFEFRSVPHRHLALCPSSAKGEKIEGSGRTRKDSIGSLIRERVIALLSQLAEKTSALRAKCRAMFCLAARCPMRPGSTKRTDKFSNAKYFLLHIQYLSVLLDECVFEVPSLTLLSCLDWDTKLGLSTEFRRSLCALDIRFVPEDTILW